MRRVVSAFTAFGLAAVAACAYGAANPRGKQTGSVPVQSAPGPVLFDVQDCGASTNGKLPEGVFVAAGTAQVVAQQGRNFLQVTDSGSIDLQLKGNLPAAYSVEIEMQVPASTGYSVEVRPESEVTPPGTASLTRRTAHPVVVCGAIASGVYGASAAQTQEKRYPNSEATQLRTCRIDVDASSVRVSFANDQAADAAGADLGGGNLLRLYVPATASQPALIGKVKVAAAAGTTVTSTQKTVVMTSMPTYLQFNAPGGVVGGALTTAEGGLPVAEPVEQLGANGVDVRPGPVRYTDIVAATPVFAFTALLNQWTSGQLGALDGRLIGYDFDHKPQYQRAFTQARLIEVTVPGLDGASKEVGYLELRLVPATTRVEAVPPGAPMPPLGKESQNVWLMSNFSIDIPGLPTNRVATVEPFKLATKAGSNYLGGTRLSVTFASVDVLPWAEWFDEFLVKGKAAPERTIEIKMLKPNRQAALLTLKGSGVGILSLTPLAQERYSAKMPRYRAELYVERWQLVPGAAADK
jgi:hypothetical protein